jgi:hypothetical protein
VKTQAGLRCILRTKRFFSEFDLWQRGQEEKKLKCVCSATNEITEGALQSFAVGANGVLSVLDTVSSGGNGPAFAAPISTGQVPIMNVRINITPTNFPADLMI